MLDNTGRRQIKIQTTQKLNTTQKNLPMQNTAKQNYPDLAAFYNIQPGNEIGLFYNAHEPTRGKSGGCTHRNRPDPTQEAVT